jgi:predicted glutamine amidotransferase
MCRLIAMTSRDYVSPMVAINGLSAMSEGYDGSGVGILLRDIGGPFENMKGIPILSGIFSSTGLKRLDRFMMDRGFTTKYKITFKTNGARPPEVPKRDVYLVRAYDYPTEWEDYSANELLQLLMAISLRLREMGEAEKDMVVFSFWPDTIMIKEIGDPVTVADYLQLDRRDLTARVIMLQGRQNTNHEIDLYACHPFFLQGYATMTNGENTAFIQNREFLMSRGFDGYQGYMSDSEVFTHSLHYFVSYLGLGLECYKHGITPLNDDAIDTHTDTAFLKHLKYTCRHLIIDGPNCVIGCLPDTTLFMVQDRKKLRPGVIGGTNGTFVFSSEICGLDAVIPHRDKKKDIQPMHLDTAVVGPGRNKVELLCQTDPLLAN